MIHAKFRPFLTGKLMIGCISLIAFILLMKYSYTVEQVNEIMVPSTTPRPILTRKIRLPKVKNITCYRDNEQGQRQRQDTCNNCSWHGYKYIVKNDRLCQKFNQTSIKIFFVILTQHSRKLQRAVIRRTWTTDSKHNTGYIRYVFLLGMSEYEKENLDIIKESKIYGDILVEDFKDTYENLTLKTIMAFKFASEKCPSAEFVMKTDDDMWINFPELLKILPVYKNELKTTVGGNCYRDVEPDRECSSKWYVSRRLYPKERYPDFCSGTAYILSLSLAREIYQISKNVPYFFLEDVYVGLCVNMLGYNVTTIPGIYNRDVVRSTNLCDYKKSNTITAHKVQPLKIETLWNLKCEGEDAYEIDFFKKNTRKTTKTITNYTRMTKSIKPIVSIKYH